MSTNTVARESRSTATTVLLLGATGRTGGRVLRQLLDRGVNVRAIVRSSARLPEEVIGHPGLSVIEADPLALAAEEWRSHLEGCGTVISCLGHTTTVRGIFGPPHDIVTPVVMRLAQTIRSMRPSTPVRLVLMSSVSVNRPSKADTLRGAGERLALSAMCGLVPPARDNQAAADFLADKIGATDSCVEWVVVRPDTLREGDVTEYRLSDGLVTSIFKPAETNMSNVAHFMCQLATDERAWAQWRGEMPVVVNAAPA